MVKRRILNVEEEDKGVSTNESPSQHSTDDQIITMESVDTSAPEPDNNDSISTAIPIKFGR